jgi:hypothetical protein
MTLRTVHYRINAGAGGPALLTVDHQHRTGAWYNENPGHPAVESVHLTRKETAEALLECRSHGCTYSRKDVYSDR